MARCGSIVVNLASEAANEHDISFKAIEISSYAMGGRESRETDGDLDTHGKFPVHINK